jgi:hypothetical protein
MQTKTGKTARGPPAEEIRDMLANICQALKNDELWDQSWQPIFSFDNSPNHTSAVSKWHEWAPSRGVQGKALMVPPYSPDLHQVVEHAIANTTIRWRRVLLENARRRTVYANVQEWYEEVCACFAGASNSIAKDVDKLDDTYKEVIRLGGGWPIAKFR